MKRFPSVPPETTPKPNKLVDKVAQHNPKVYHEKLDPIELEGWIQGMEKKDSQLLGT